MSITTTHIKPTEIRRIRYCIDAEGVSLGRLATLATNLLRGKEKPTFSVHMDGGNIVYIINASKVVLTGNKAVQKIDFRHSGHHGGDFTQPYSALMAKNPERAVELAIYGMLPKNRLRDRFRRHLKVYRDASPEAMKNTIVVDMKNPKLRSGGPYGLPAEPSQEKHV
ncbi:MAG TPA: 50S ribosomal protein L13 [Elusimicrobiota bacterium]|nr:50S ribosomal protein L13 [Elusimicrobiota bacterium]